MKQIILQKVTPKKFNRSGFDSRIQCSLIKSYNPKMRFVLECKNGYFLKMDFLRRLKKYS